MTKIGLKTCLERIIREDLVEAYVYNTVQKTFDTEDTHLLIFSHITGTLEIWEEFNLQNDSYIKNNHDVLFVLDYEYEMEYYETIYDYLNDLPEGYRKIILKISYKVEELEKNLKKG